MPVLTHLPDIFHQIRFHDNLLQSCYNILLLASGTETKRKNYTRYIATRETVEIREQNIIERETPATEKQQELLSDLLKDFPEAKKYLEYEDYKNDSTVENASELISAIIERNACI